MEALIIILPIAVILLLYIRWRKKLLLRRREAKQLALEKSQLSDNFSKINEWMLEDQRFKDAGLRLDIVAKEVRLSEREVSSAINTVSGENFNLYINRLRIGEAQRLLTDPSHGHFTIDAIAEMVGFSNKVSFYKAFKKVTDQSPSDFRKDAKAI